MSPAELLSVVVTTLQVSPLCQNVRILETQQFSATQYALKVRAQLVAGGTLQVRFYVNGDHVDYAYQLFQDEAPVVRWDNKEHFPHLASYPHHFHNAGGQVEGSALVGDAEHDLPVVLAYLSAMLA